MQRTPFNRDDSSTFESGFLENLHRIHGPCIGSLRLSDEKHLQSEARQTLETPYSQGQCNVNDAPFLFINPLPPRPSDETENGSTWIQLTQIYQKATSETTSQQSKRNKLWTTTNTQVTILSHVALTTSRQTPKKHFLEDTRKRLRNGQLHN